MYDASQLPKVIYGINWATRTFNRNDPESPQDKIVEKPQEPAAPKPEEPKKKAVVIEVMPDEPMPEGYADYRPLLQRDGLILWAWEIYENKMKIIWLLSNRTMRKYETTIYDEIDNELLLAVCPEGKYNVDHWGHNTVPDYIFYAAPANLTMNTRKAFIAKLKASGVSVNFDYEYSLGRQRQEEEKAVADKIQNCKFITADEAEILEVYRQLSNEGKTELIKSMEALLNEQEREIKNA